jgi:putative intracellular protease/amidase
MKRSISTWSTFLALTLSVTGRASAQEQHAVGIRDRPRILMVVTSHGAFEEHGMKTGLWLEEFAVPYRMFREAGYEVTVASPLGGQVPVDPRSLAPESAPANQEAALEILEDSVRLDEVTPALYDAAFFPGGHGTMFDFPQNEKVQRAVVHFLERRKPVALVCHGPAALIGANTPMGDPLVRGRKVAAFTNEEEKQAGLEKAVPFLLQSRLESLGASVVTAEPFMENVVVDDRLITGQNPASSAKAARELIKQLE